ncbi:hypothetical protein [Glutamicibacter halophytocola]|uniref:hypothetical protein n=1 Tax=Glutamicibacter halophytocola TaxID=1933880 RepID=UPI0015C52B53|nr:hypothetical protein [Glutamicibacter halophytocola]NQD42458.1 hypothetical protein [Glutamicibacter halophytocola]
MVFSVFRENSDDGLRGPSVEALKKGHRIFYGEHLEGPAKGTLILVEVLSSRRVTKKLVGSNTGKSMFPVGLEILVTLRSAGPGSYTLFPEVDVGWEFFTLAPGEEEEWLTGQPIQWFTHRESKAEEKDFHRVY